MEKIEIAKRGRFFCTFLSVVNTLVKKISIINSRHLFLVSSHVFNSSVAFDANFLRSFLLIPFGILRKLSLLFFWRKYCYQIWLVHSQVFFLSSHACY